MKVDTIRITKQQQEVLYNIVKFWKRKARLPTDEELSSNLPGKSPNAARGLKHRLANRGFINYKGRRSELNEERIIIWSETAKAVLQLTHGKQKREEFIINTVNEIKIDRERFEKRILPKLIRDGYIREPEGAPDSVVLGNTSADLSEYLKLLAEEV